MAVLAFDESKFRTMFPEFSTSPDATTLAAYWDVATAYISAEDVTWFMLTGAARELGLYQMTAHISKLSALTAAGTTPAVETQATIDKVSVTIQPPPVKNQFQWWLSTTPYGAMLLALLAGATAGGLYIPGGAVSERGAFRTAGGGFGGRTWLR